MATTTHTPVLGTKVRALRRKENMSQAELARRLGVSASYLNLIESNRRPLPAQLLLQLAEIFKLDLQAFSTGEGTRLLADLMAAMDDPMFEGHALAAQDVRELAIASPAMAQAMLTLYRAYQGVREQMETLTSRVSEDEGAPVLDRARLPSEQVSDFLQRHMNYFPELEEAAAALWRDAGLQPDGLFRGLTRYLHDIDDIQVHIAQARETRATGAMRSYDPQRKLLTLSELLGAGTLSFQVAHQIGLLCHSSTLGRLARDPLLTTDESRALCRVALANYFAGAVLMPYGPFLLAARSERYDIELLCHRFRVSFEQVCHRLTTLRNPSDEGVPFHMLRVDIAGNISKRFSASGIRFARFGGACPRWNVHSAFLTPGMIRVQLSRMPDGTTYFCMGRTLRKEVGGFHAAHPLQAVGLGCEVRYARQLVYSDGIDLDNQAAPVPVGLACRVCERMDCEQRAFPPLQQPLRIDENVRGSSFYVPVSQVLRPAPAAPAAKDPDQDGQGQVQDRFKPV